MSSKERVARSTSYDYLVSAPLYRQVECRRCRTLTLVPASQCVFPPAGCVSLKLVGGPTGSVQNTSVLLADVFDPPAPTATTCHDTVFATFTLASGMLAV